MRLEVARFSLRIIPESPQDAAYIEEVLGLKEGGQYIHLLRIDAMGLSALAYLETHTPKRIRRYDIGNKLF